VKSLNGVVPLVLIAAGAILAVGLFSFLSNDPHPPAEATGGGDEYVGAVDGLCLAQQSATERDVDGARAYFEDLSHAALHEIAARVEAADRPLAGDLLEAKQRVEADLAAGRAATLATDLGSLIDSTGVALAALGIESGGCAL
jgi:hypothetical protein